MKCVSYFPLVNILRQQFASKPERLTFKAHQKFETDHNFIVCPYFENTSKIWYSYESSAGRRFMWVSSLTFPENQGGHYKVYLSAAAVMSVCGALLANEHK